MCESSHTYYIYIIYIYIIYSKIYKFNNQSFEKKISKYVTCFNENSNIKV